MAENIKPNKNDYYETTTVKNIGVGAYHQMKDAGWEFVSQRKEKATWRRISSQYYADLKKYNEIEQQKSAEAEGIARARQEAADKAAAKLTEQIEYQSWRRRHNSIESSKTEGARRTLLQSKYQESVHHNNTAAEQHQKHLNSEEAGAKNRNFSTQSQKPRTIDEPSQSSPTSKTLLTGSAQSSPTAIGRAKDTSRSLTNPNTDTLLTAKQGDATAKPYRSRGKYVDPEQQVTIDNEQRRKVRKGSNTFLGVKQQ